MRITHFAPVVLLLSAACSDERRTSRPVEDVPVVSLVRAGTPTGPAQVEADGTAALRREIPLAFTTGGKIASVLVRDGDRVRVGQLLASLDATNVGAALEQAAAENDRAQADLSRIEQLFRQGWVTAPRLESAQAAARNARAALASRRFARSTARIVAPAGGVILARQAEPGQVIEAGMPVVSLGDVASGFVLKTPVSDRDAVRLVRGAKARVRFDALPGELFDGQVLEVSGRSDRGSGAFSLEISLPVDARLRSGLVGHARIEATPGRSATRLVIPPVALFAVRADEGFAYVLTGKDRVRLRRLRIGAVDNQGVEVLDGLTPGEQVVASELDRLKDGARVRPGPSRP